MPTQDDLRTLLSRELLLSLAGHGWSAAEGDRFGTVVALTRELPSGLTATVRIGSAAAVWGSVVWIRGIYVGVGYAPLRELSRLTGSYDLEVVESPLYTGGVLAGNGDDGDGDDGDGDDGDGVDPEGESEPAPARGRRELEFRARTSDEVKAVVQQLTALVTEHGCWVADRYADVDELIAAVPPLESAALLCAAGRLTEAAEALERVSATTGSDSSEAQRRCAYQLRRWIQSGGDRALLPAAPAPSRRTPSEQRRPSFSAIWGGSRERTEDRNAAHRAARARSSGLTRSEQLAILAEEFESRDMSRSPIDLEVALEHLWDTRTDQLKVVGNGALAIGRFGVRAVKALRGDEQERQELGRTFDLTDELNAPEPAYLDAPTDERTYVGVELHERIDPTLGQIYRLSWPKIMKVGVIRDVWLTAAEPGAIAVHVGEWEVGTLRGPTAGAFAQVMQEASFRGELPKLPGRIARLGDPSRYLLDVAVPAAR